MILKNFKLWVSLTAIAVGFFVCNPVKATETNKIENSRTNSENELETEKDRSDVGNSEDDWESLEFYHRQENRRSLKNKAGASRGCPSQIATDFYLLAPENGVVATAKNNPTFYIYIDSIPDTELRYSVGNERLGDLLDRQITVNRKGIIPLQIDLENGILPSDRYYLTIGLICKEGEPSDDKTVRTVFRKIDPETIFLSKSSSETVKSLLDRGIWYDALEQAYSSNDRILFSSLLEKIDFVEAPFVE